jgi:hypothetical protein
MGLYEGRCIDCGKPAAALVGLGFLLFAVAAFAADPDKVSKANCDAVSDASLIAAISEARTQAEKVWLVGDDWRLAFDVKGTAPNPFDLKKDEAVPASEPFSGLVWARDVVCSVEGAHDAAPVVVSFSAKRYRTREGDAAWSMPLKNGLLAIYEMVRDGDRWIAHDRSSERSILLPEAILRRPTTAELERFSGWPVKQNRSGAR